MSINMPKKVLQDISTRNTDKEENFNRKWDYSQGDGIVEREKSDSVNKLPNTEYSSNTEYNKSGNRSGGSRKGPLGFSKKAWFVISALVIIVLSLVFWSMSATAIVKVVLSQQTTTINDNFSAVLGTNEGTLNYQVIKLQKKTTKDLQPTKEEKVERKASGQITIYNKSGEGAEKLIANTRFASPGGPDGKIYRIDKAVTVPSAKGSGDSLVPGSIEVTVYADQIGNEYNIGLVDFTVPGLKDTPLFDKVFAKSKTEMSGGSNGILKTASEEEIKNAEQALQQELRTSLLEEARSAVGEDRVLYEDAVFINFSTHTPTEVSENGMLTIEETGDLQVFVFDKKELSSEIAKKSLSSYDGSTVLVRNFDELNFAFENKEQFDSAVSESFNFVLSGSPRIVWEVDQVAFKKSLAGLSKNSISTVIQNYPSVRKIEAEIKPFWKGSFPDNPDSITIQEVLE